MLLNLVLKETLESPLDSKEIKPVNPKGNQSWIFIESTDVEVVTPIHLIWRTASLEKTLMLGKIEGRRRRGQQRMRWLDGITDLMDMSLSKLRSWWWTRKPGVLQSTGLQRVGHDWATELSCWDLQMLVEKLPPPQWLKRLSTHTHRVLFVALGIFIASCRIFVVLHGFSSCGVWALEHESLVAVVCGLRHVGS